MDKMNFWNPRKDNDYRFIDSIILEYFEIGGVSVFLHKYLGPQDQGSSKDLTQPGLVQSQKTGVTQVQDLFFQENRDRSYDPNVYEMKAIYNMMDTEFDIRQFGMFLEADSYFLFFHLNDIVDKIGRKLMSGDVLEMYHMRDDALLDENAPAINKFYQITDVNRSANGWSVSWRPHILRVKVKPLTDSQEFSQILNIPVGNQVGGGGALDGENRATGDGTGVINEGFNIGDLISDFRNKIMLSDAIQKEAELMVPYRNFDASNIWIVPGTETGKEHPWIFTGDGIPPNSSIKAQSGTDFPVTAIEGSYFLQVPDNRSQVDVDRGIARLFKRINGLWIFQEVDLRLKWESAHRILQSFINNKNITNTNGEKFPEKQAISKTLLPRALPPKAD